MIDLAMGVHLLSSAAGLLTTALLQSPDSNDLKILSCWREKRPLSGQFRLGNSAKLGCIAQEQELLDSANTALDTIRQAAPLNQTEARSFLHYFLFSGDDPLRPIAQLSYGERARLSLALLIK